MKKEKSSVNRRDFFSSLLPACSLTCLGSQTLFASALSFEKIKNDEDHKFKTEVCKTLEKDFRQRFGFFITRMKLFKKYLGEEKLLELLKKSIDDINDKRFKDKPDKSFQEFKDMITGMNNTLTLEVVEDTDNIFELKVTECIWAKTFLARKAGDIGYASICHGDYSSAPGFNSKMHMERTKTLMEGHDCCNHRYILDK